MKHLDHYKFSYIPQSFNAELSTELNVLLNALNLTKAGLVVTDCSQPDDPIIYCNAAFEELCGYTQAEVVGRNCRFLQGADDNIEQRKFMKETIKAGRDCSLEIKNYKKDGTPFWNELYLKAIKDANGKLIYYVGIQNKVSKQETLSERIELKRQKRALFLIEKEKLDLKKIRFLYAILNTISESFLILDERMTILQVNPSFLKTFHLAEEEILNKNLFEIQQGKWDFMALRNLFEHLNAKKDTIKNYKIEHIFANVGKKMLNVNAHFVQYKKSYKIILAIEDITEVTEIERRKDDFLDVASHELKTPLTTVMSSLQLAQRMLPVDSNPKLKETLKKAKEYVDKLENLVADLLDASKIKSGKIELTRCAFNFDKMVFDVVAHLKIIHEHVVFNVNGFASNYYVGDQKRLEQVMLQLLKNSIKFSPRGSQIDVHLSRLSNHVKIAITDNGLGVSHQNQKKIFENFFRVDEIQKQFAGIGTGLYVSDQIIRSHGGTLWVESKVGEGATFSFTLPLKDTPI